MSGNYEKSMFKQLQDAIGKIEELSFKVNRIESETENKYLKIIYEKDAEIAMLRVENAVLMERVVKLEDEVDRLRKQLNINSGNSSSPPAKDIKSNAPNTFNTRTKTDRKSGGQRGQEGHCLSKKAVLEKIQKGEVSHTVVGHGNPSGKYISKFVLDSNFVIIAKEHRFYAD